MGIVGLFGRLRAAHIIGFLAWLGVMALVIRARLDTVLQATHAPGKAAYDLPLILTTSAVRDMGQAVAAWTSLSGVDGVGIAIRAVIADALAAALLLASTAVALHIVGGYLTRTGVTDRATVGGAALRARWFALAAIGLRIAGDVGAGWLILAADDRALPSSLQTIGIVLAVIEGAGVALAAAALGILAVAAAWAALGHRDGLGNLLRSLLTVRVHVLVVLFFGALVLAPIIGPQLDDVILRWQQEPGDAVVAGVAMLWLGVVLLLVTDHLLAKEREPRRNASLVGMLVLCVALGALGIAAPGLWVLAGILGALLVLSLFFLGMDGRPHRKSLMAKREPIAGSLVPVVLAMGPISMLGLAVVRAAAGEAALSGGVFWLFVVGGIVIPPLLGVLIQLVPRRGLVPVVIASALIAAAVAVGLFVNPWRWGDLLGVIGIFACFAVILSLVGFAIAAVDLLWRPPPVLLVLGQRRLPILAIFALWAIGAALLLPARDYHDIRRLALRKGTPARVDVNGAWRDWLTRNGLGAPPATGAPVSAGARRGVPLVIVAASGGGIRAAYWTARVVDCAIDRRARPGCAGKPGSTRRIFAASGNSGGSVGLASWAAHRVSGDQQPGRVWVDNRLGEDYFAPAWARTLFADLPEGLLQAGARPDRGAVLERAWEQSWTHRQTSFASLFDGPQPSQGPLTAPMRDLSRRARDMPLLLFSGTSVTDGCRTNTSRLRADALQKTTDRCASPDPFAAGDKRTLSPRATFGATRDVFGACKSSDLRLSTAALLSARFPIISPPGRVACGQPDELQIVDGGYFDNSAASPVQELWARLAPLVDDFNRRSAGSCVVPVMLQIDNAYVSTAPPPDATPRALVAPLTALANARSARETGAEQATAISFGQPRLEDGSRPEARPAPGSGARALDRYVQIFPRVQPGAQAPLGWTLSKPSRESLSAQVESKPNRDALSQVQRWFDRSLRCTV
jgi:hypothetical protein